MDNVKSVLEVIQTDKQLMALIHSNITLPADLLDLYREVRTQYEKILLNSDQLSQLQEVEYHLWKLNYKLIDEFRKKKYEGLNSFLSEATGFYGDMIVKLRKKSGIPQEIFLTKKYGYTFSVETAKLHMCHYICHRLLICVGDLARYVELAKKPDSCEWSTAANYYIEATRICPDSGNPHNQLALLATYVGDSFLALYHCIRSLAVKEPFPDAWRNLMLVLDENRSIPFGFSSSQIPFDFMNPSKTISLLNTSSEENNSSYDSNLEDTKKKFPENFELWPAFVRTIGFLLTRSSLEEFPRALATTIHGLEALLASDDTKLTALLESYKYMDASKRGPYRAIQFVSILIFIIQNLTENPKTEDYQSSSTPLVYASTFIFMGRLTTRCMTGSHESMCPLLPAVLLFLEWLVGSLDLVETHEVDERVKNAKSYFFGSLVDLMARIKQNKSEKPPDCAALWEDQEFRGFIPVANGHEKRDFTTHLDGMENSDSGNESRLHRIFLAESKIFNKSNSFLDSINGLEMKEPELDPKTEPATEDDEIILFKPITRSSSAPVYVSNPTNDHLRRATSLLLSQSPTEVDSVSLCSTSPYAGPPSLNAWVLGQNIENVKDFNKRKLCPVDEMTSELSFADLSIRRDDVVPTSNFPTLIDSPIYVAPTPSAPSLPDDAVWLRGNSLISPEYRHVGIRPDGILGAPPIIWNQSPFRSPASYISGGVEGYPPFVGMSSSEWLYHYRNSQNALGNIQAHENTGFDLFDQWGNRVYFGNHQVYPSSSIGYGEEVKRDRLFLDYQRVPFPYVYSVGVESSSVQVPVRQFLKEREWQLQPGSQVRDGAFM